MRRKWIFGIAFAAVFLVSAFSLWALVLWDNPAHAAQPERVEKLRIDGTRWDRVSQQFVVDISCKAGIAGAGDKAVFWVSTELWVDTGVQLSIVLTHESVVSKLEGATKDAEGKIQLEPQYIPWDRMLDSGEYFTGEAYVTTKIVLKNRHGGTIGNVVSKFNVINIEAPGG